MKVDSRRIRLEREKRAWTQEHLAKASGLGVRTVQRIETNGTASFESVRALAAVLSLSVAELRTPHDPVKENDSLAAGGAFAGLPLRLLLAAISGGACALSLEWAPFLTFLSWPYVTLAGLLFGGAVLCPYLRRGGDVAWRAVALIAASSLSYFCAVSIVAEGPHEWLGASRTESPQAFLLASFVGASIVFVAARFLVPLRTTIAYWLFGALASVVGGAFMYVGGELVGHLPGAMGGFAAWHVSMCLAIHFGRHSNPVGRRVAETLLDRKSAHDRTMVGFVQIAGGR